MSKTILEIAKEKYAGNPVVRCAEYNTDIYQIDSESIEDLRGSIFAGTIETDNKQILYDHQTGEWAEIVSQPQEGNNTITFTKQEDFNTEKSMTIQEEVLSKEIKLKVQDGQEIKIKLDLVDNTFTLCCDNGVRDDYIDLQDCHDIDRVRQIGYLIQMAADIALKELVADEVGKNCASAHLYYHNA